MKKHIYILGIIVLIVDILLVGSVSGKTKTSRPSGVLSVNDIQADPSAYKGVVTITGVVAKVDPSHPEYFALIDTKDSRECASASSPVAAVNSRGMDFVNLGSMRATVGTKYSDTTPLLMPSASST